jgi:hypothetical protein
MGVEAGLTPKASRVAETAPAPKMPRQILLELLEAADDNE